MWTSSLGLLHHRMKGLGCCFCSVDGSISSKLWWGLSISSNDG